MLYTIAEVSDLIGLSKVSIYKKMKLKEIQEHLSKKQGVTYITEQGFNLIKENLKLKEEVKTELKHKEIDNSGSEEVATDSENFNVKIDYINTLKEQLKVKDLQIQDLNNRLTTEQELTKNMQILQLRQQPQQNIKVLEEHFQELDTKLFDIKEQMIQRKDQNQKTQHQDEDKKHWFNKILRNK